MPKESNLSAKQRLFLDALISEEAMGDLRTAMRIAGYSDNTKVAHTAKELRGEIREATETLLAMYAPKAAYSLTSVLENPDTFNARHIISAAKEILDRTGLVKKEPIEVSSNSGGIFILPPKSKYIYTPNINSKIGRYNIAFKNLGDKDGNSNSKETWYIRSAQ